MPTWPEFRSGSGGKFLPNRRLGVQSSFATGRSSAWQSAWFGTKRSQVQILSPRFGIVRHELHPESSSCPSPPLRFASFAALGSLLKNLLLKTPPSGCIGCFLGWPVLKNCLRIPQRMMQGWSGCGRHGMPCTAHGMNPAGSRSRTFPVKKNA